MKMWEPLVEQMFAKGRSSALSSKSAAPVVDHEHVLSAQQIYRGSVYEGYLNTHLVIQPCKGGQLIAETISDSSKAYLSLIPRKHICPVK